MVDSVQIPSAASQTGLSNTRSKCQNSAESVNDCVQLASLPVTHGLKLGSNLEVSVDYLVIATHHATHEDFQRMIDFISLQTSDEFCLEFDNSWSPGKGCKKYQHSGSSVKGCRLGWNVDDDGVSHTWIAIPGNSLRQIKTRIVWRLCVGLLHTWKAECRRFDSALDDYARRVKPHEILQAYEEKNYALFDKCVTHAESTGGAPLIPTIYLGSRESEKFVRFYDAEKKHGIPCDRWEVELKRRHAHEAFQYFCNLSFDSNDEQEFEQLVSQFLAGLVTGAIDFVYRFPDGEEKERYSRCERLPWWKSLCDEVGAGIRLSPARPKPSLERSLQWIKRQVSVVVSALKDGWGATAFYAWLNNELSDAKSRYSARHEAIIRQLRNEMEVEEVSGYV